MQFEWLLSMLQPVADTELWVMCKWRQLIATIVALVTNTLSLQPFAQSAHRKATWPPNACRNFNEC